jgi:hypothetical protein
MVSSREVCKERWSADACLAQIEYLVVAFDDEKREVKLSLRQADILAALASDAELIKQGGGVPDLLVGEEKYVEDRNWKAKEL